MMAKWHFLSQWSDVLRPLAVAATPIASYDSLVPRISHIEVKLPRGISQTTLLVVRQAIELMGRALLVDSSLWALFRVKPQRFEQNEADKCVDPRAFRDEDLVPAFELVWEDDDDYMAFDEWLKCVGNWLPTEIQPTSGAFAQAMEQVQRLDGFRIAAPAVYKVPVSLRVEVTDSSAADTLATTLERVAVVAPLQGLRLTHVDVVLFKVDDAVATAIARLQAVGIVVRRVAVGTSRLSIRSSGSVSTLVGPHSRLTAPFQSLELPHTVGMDATGEFCAALLHGPESVVVEMPPSLDPDCLLMCRAVRVATSRRHDNRHFDIMLPNLTSERAADFSSALQRVSESESITSVRVATQTRDGASLGEQLRARGIDSTTRFSAIVGSWSVVLFLPDGQLLKGSRSSVVEEPRSDKPVADRNDAQQRTDTLSLRLSKGVCEPNGLAPVLAFFQCFTGTVTSLDLEIVRDATVSVETVTAILASYPLLECLKLNHTALTTMDMFLDAYRNQQCRLRVLSIDSGHVGFVPFSEELAQPDTVIAKTLRELKIGYPESHVDEDGETYLRAMTAMLMQNHTLQFFELVVATPSAALVSKLATALRPFHCAPLACASPQPLPLEAKLAFVGATTLQRTCTTKTQGRRLSSDGRLPRTRVPPGLQTLILAFAAPCRARIVHLRHEKSRVMREGKVNGGCKWREIVEEELVGL